MSDFSFIPGGKVWMVLIQFLLLLCFLVIGNLIRRSVPFLRKSFIPSALIGGVLLALLGLLIKWVTPNHYHLIDKDIMQIITYHALAIGFIAMTLKVANKEKKKGLGILSIQNGFITGATYMLQAMFGIITAFVFVWCAASISEKTGFILPLAFGQGPGNALIWDKNFSIANGSFGLALASIGFIVASIIGVVYLNYYKRKGEINRGTEILERRVEEFIEDHEIEDSDSVDKLSIQVGIVAVCYAITFGIMCALSFTTFTKNIAWGFNFIFGVISATLVKFVLVFLKKKKIIKYKYINNYQMDRISGFSFDLMIIAGVAAIEINDIKNYIWIIIALTIVGSLITFLYVKFMTKHCFKGLEHEMFLVNFGTLTGTASNGVILLREADSSFQTPASNIFVVSQFPAMIGVAPLIVLLPLVQENKLHPLIAMGIFALLAVVYTVIILVLGRKLKNQQNNN